MCDELPVILEESEAEGEEEEPRHAQADPLFTLHDGSLCDRAGLERFLCALGRQRADEEAAEAAEADEQGFDADAKKEKAQRRQAFWKRAGRHTKRVVIIDDEGAPARCDEEAAEQLANYWEPVFAKKR